jgi:hypothetical protein
MADLKHLISPFWLMPSAGKLKIKQIPRPAPPCNCDSDDENNFGMAPECAFVCNWFAPARKTSRKRNPKKDHHLKKTKRHNKS